MVMALKCIEVVWTIDLATNEVFHSGHALEYFTDSCLRRYSLHAFWHAEAELLLPKPCSIKTAFVCPGLGV